jgi:energy-coupling factor transport system permease protein
MMGLAALCTWLISLAAPSMPFTPRGILLPFMRGLVMLNVVLPLALTCRVQELLTALKSLHLPFCIYIPGAVMIRFIPTFMSDIKQVSETLKIRGYNLGFREMFRHPLMMLRLLFTPLLFRSLRTSEELGIAAELKGLEAGGTFVPFRQAKWTHRDTFLILTALAVCAFALYCHWHWGVTAGRGMR